MLAGSAAPSRRRAALQASLAAESRTVLCLHSHLPALLLLVDRRLRVSGCPVDPLHPDAVQLGEARAAFGGSAGDVPVQAGPLIDERRRLYLGIDPEDPPCIPLEPRGAPGLTIGRRRAGRPVPEHDA